MPAEVELHPDVVSFVRYRCSREEQDEFRKKLIWIRAKPIARSELYAESKKWRFALRCFRFGRGVEKIAIFACDTTRERTRIRVLECRLGKPRRLRDEAKPDESSAP